MPGSCPFINAKGETCGKGFAAGNSHCAHHRVRPAPKPSHPCASCGRPTKRAQGVCLGKSCGWNAYRRELAARKKAAAAAAQTQAAEELAAQDAAEENQRRTEEAAEELAAALDGLRPWPEWMGVTADEFEAAGEREVEARAAEHRRQEAEATAALVEALQAAEAEAAAAAARDRAAREQLDRLRRACAATRLGTLVPAGAALAR